MKDLRDEALPVEKPFFEGCHQGLLRLQRCKACGEHQFYPRLMCHQCWERDLEWVDVSGQGRIASYTVARLPVSSAFEAPYVVALVRLAEGPTMMSQIVDCNPGELEVGAPVRVTFAPIGDCQSLPVFRLDS